MLNANSLGFSCSVVILWGTHELKTSGFGSTDSAGLERWVPPIALSLCTLVYFKARSRSAALVLGVGQAII
jgi:hypothetical protein